MRIVFLWSVLNMVGICGHAQVDTTEIMLLGTDHLSQVYSSTGSDVSSADNQSSIQDFASKIARFNPDMIMVEQLPGQQQEVDSLYALYQKDHLDLNTVDYPRHELYQLAFRIGGLTNVPAITCVNYKGGTSQGILDNGDHIEIYERETQEIRKIVKAKYGALRSGALNYEGYLTFLNRRKHICESIGYDI